ncbi:MAG: peptidoglycan-binding protein, partial [Clostridia bacterium]|nr:peptidoglycan-binding protein [Clostridia bacterium]
MAYNQNDPADVREVQEYLRQLARSFPRIPLLAVDGIYGPETAEAVRVFQELFGLSPTGEVDSTTWETLGREYRRVIYPTTRPQP